MTGLLSNQNQYNCKSKRREYCISHHSLKYNTPDTKKHEDHACSIIYAFGRIGLCAILHGCQSFHRVRANRTLLVVVDVVENAAFELIVISDSGCDWSTLDQL